MLAVAWYDDLTLYCTPALYEMVNNVNLLPKVQYHPDPLLELYLGQILSSAAKPGTHFLENNKII